LHTALQMQAMAYLQRLGPTQLTVGTLIAMCCILHMEQMMGTHPGIVRADDGASVELTRV
jgi:hypothetical protein